MDKYRITAKRSKSSVNYSEGMPQSNCGICRYYTQGFYKGSGKCDLVKGEIDADMWCELFEKSK